MGAVTYTSKRFGAGKNPIEFQMQRIWRSDVGKWGGLGQWSIHQAAVASCPFDPAHRTCSRMTDDNGSRWTPPKGGGLRAPGWAQVAQGAPKRAWGASFWGLGLPACDRWGLGGEETLGDRKTGEPLLRWGRPGQTWLGASSGKWDSQKELNCSCGLFGF